MRELGRRKRTKWVQLIVGCALLLMVAPYAQRTDRQVWIAKAIQVSAAAAEAPRELARDEMPLPRVEAKSAVSGSVDVVPVTRK